MSEITRDTLTCDVALSLVESLPDPALLLSPDRRVRHLNRACRKAFGTGDEAIGSPCYSLLHHRATPCDRSVGDCPVARSLRTGQPARTLHVHHRPGRPEHQTVTVFPLGHANGTPRGFLGILQGLDAATPTAIPDRLSGSSPAFNCMLEQMHRVAPTDLPVLVLGESGTGKGLVAEAIHQMSGRRGGPFVRVACSGIEEEFLRGELFGHEPGAFPGAFGRTAGRVGSAKGGSLFLDEVGDLPLLVQAEVLRLLETHGYERLGGAEPLRADVRLILATHFDLREQVERRAFRADLHNRVSAFPIVVPPLRARREDLPELIEGLLHQIARPHTVGLHPDALALLTRYNYPGNIRELRNILERSTLLATGDVILPGHLPARCQGPSGDGDLPDRPTTTLESALGTGTQEILPLAAIEERYLRWASNAFRGDKASLAKRLGIGERTLYRKLRHLRAPGLEPRS